MKTTANLLAAGLMLGLIVALQSAGAATAVVTQPAEAPTPTAQSATEQSIMAIPVTPPLAGKVLETMTTGGYTYISLEKDGKQGWVAVPSTKVVIGQEIQVKPGVEMGLFSSKTLNRSFDNIVFSTGLVTETNVQATQNLQGAGAATNIPAAPSAAASKPKPKGMAAMFGSIGEESTGSLSGKVVETMDSGGYTYINLEKDGKQTWVAVPTMKVTVGQQMELQPGAAMKNFTSKSLNKTFDSVIFSGGPIHSK